MTFGVIINSIKYHIMKILQITIACILLSISSKAQTLFNDPYRAVVSTDYTVELAIKYEDKLLSDMPWSQSGLMLGMQMYGQISLQIVEDSERLSAIDAPTFQIAIKDNKTGTLRLYSDKVYTDIKADDLVSQCKDGESVIILTTDRKYVLKQNQIELLLGC